MSGIRLATAANVLAFQNLTNVLETSNGKWAGLIDSEALQDEVGRFRVWSGNLGALQKGHSSLDYRLRDSPLLSSNALKLLKELEENINEAFAIISEARLPYELQTKPETTDEENNDDDDDFFDEDDDEDDDAGSQTELSMRFSEVVDIIDNLYKLSVRIRTPTIRSRSLKAATYKPKDPETGVDILSTYAEYDLQHVKELLRYLRHPREGESESADYEYLATRLSAAITLRRRQFKYWKRHRDKLGMSTVQEEHAHLEQPQIGRPELPPRHDTLEVLPDVPAIVTKEDAPSQKTGKTLLSGTEATQHHQSLDQIVDTKSVTSYAVTVKDLHGKGVELPPPPRAADGDKDFECPYCYIICPARYGRGRAWRTHLLQDLQPYVCTYPDCNSAEQLFRSRREWAEHEASHRKVWRCPEHPAAVYKTSIGLEDHFRHQHADNFLDSQLPAIVRVGETTTVDERRNCPICSAPADIVGPGDFHNHIANHLERIATFALPNDTEDNSDGGSSAASRGRSVSSESRNMSDLSLPNDTTEGTEALTDFTAIESGHVTSTDLSVDKSAPHAVVTAAVLSAESLQQLPDASQDRLGTLLTGDGSQHVERKSTRASDTDSSGYFAPSSYAMDEDDKNKMTILKVSDIPTVSSLYRTRRLQQRDQSVAPNALYNRIISFCHHDLTKLKVDAIVNSANKSMKMTGGRTLNNAIHRAAGAGLAAETRLAGKLEDKAILTSAYQLPSKHVIHVLRPGYSKSRGMGQFNQLVDCYREAFRIAIDHKLKTIAFPCLGTGGVGFPARVASRITLQEIREYLDTHPEHGLERVIFCVNTAADEKAYIDFLPVYFPPTHDDLDTARSVWSEDYAAVAIQVLETRNEIQKVFSELNLGLSLSVPDFPQDVLTHFAAIDSALASIRRFLLWSNELNKNLRDLKLVCSVVQLFCGSITEIIDLAKDHANLGQRSDQSIWDDYVTDMNNRQGTDPSGFLQACRDLAEGLDSMITGNGYDLDEIIEMVETRQKIERFKIKQRGGRDAERAQDHLNEVLYTRQFQRETISQARDVVRLHQIRSVTQLYQIGELEEKSTLALPSELSNDRVYLAREDVTQLEVDVIVNSTDVSFRGIGTLDRTVLQKGGDQMRQAVEAFGKCKIGDIRTTEGYMLPAKHVIHVVPPGIYNKDTKGILRKIYREVLHEAVIMRATSIALPSIGTGMLNYPRRDSASLALEETKRFLESAELNSSLEKIIFVVYSSNDEFIYKSLLPVYFPPLGVATGTSPGSVTRQNTGVFATSESSEAPRRTLFGSIGEAFRSVRLGKQVDTSRPITANEEHALIEFESHAKDCDICRDVDKLYLEGRDLCKDGYLLAQTVLWHMNMQSDQRVFTKPDSKGQSVKLEFPTEMFPITMALLSTVEKSYRDRKRSRPFVTPNRDWSAITQDQGVYTSLPSAVQNEAEVEVPGYREPKRARARVLVTLESESEPAGVSPRDCQIEVHLDRVLVFPHTDNDESRGPLLSLGLKQSSVVQRYRTTPEVELDGVTRLMSSTLRTKGKVFFRCRSDDECNSLLRAVRRAIEHIQDSRDAGDGQETLVPPLEPEGKSSDEYLQWNQRLKDIRSELAANPRASGGLGDLQYKVDRLGAAASNIGTPSEQEAEQKTSSKGLIDLDLVMKNLDVARSKLETTQQQKSDASNLYDFSKNRLATRILLCLTEDLKSRPGFYIGFKTDSIVSSLNAEKQEVLAALKELEDADQVHNTVNKDTWVITHAPKDLPALSKEQLEAGIQPAGTAFDEPPAPKQLPDSDVPQNGKPYIECDACDNPLPRGAIVSYPTAASNSLASQTRGPTAQKVLAHLVEFAKVPKHGGLHILDIASATGVSHEEVGDALAVLEAAGKAHIHGTNALWWAVTTKHVQRLDEAHEGSKTVVDDTPDFESTLFNPTKQPPSDATTQKQPDSGGRVLHNGKEYDHVLDVEIEDSKPLKLAYNIGESRSKAARRFLDENGLPHIYSLHVTGLIKEQTQNVTPGQSSEQLTIRPDSTPAQGAAQVHGQKSKAPADREQEVDAGTKSTQPQLNPTTEKVYTYLLNYTFVPPDSAHHILDIAAAVYLTREEVRQALAELRDLGLANVSEKDGWWRATKAEVEDQSVRLAPSLVAVRDPPEFQDTPPSPAAGASASASISSYFVKNNIDDYFNDFSPAGSEHVRWTRVDKRLVHPESLTVAGEEFEDVGDNLIVHRVLRRGEIKRWAEESLKRERDESTRAAEEATNSDITANERTVALTPSQTAEHDAIVDTNRVIRRLHQTRPSLVEKGITINELRVIPNLLTTKELDALSRWDRYTIEELRTLLEELKKEENRARGERKGELQERQRESQNEIEGDENPVFGKYLFTWEHPANEVFVTGTFDDWQKTIKLEKIDGIFQKIVELPKRAVTHYKFVVDGQWAINERNRKDELHDGSVNNVVWPDDIIERSQEETPVVVGDDEMDAVELSEPSQREREDKGKGKQKVDVVPDVVQRLLEPETQSTPSTSYRSSNTPAPAPGQTPNRDIMFCHQCASEWWRVEHGVTCPDCGSDFTEIVDSTSSATAGPTVPALNLTAPSPTLTPTETDLEIPSETALLASPYTFPNGNKWTRVDKRLVKSQILADAGEIFTREGDDILIHRAVDKEQLTAWAEMSGWRREEITKGKDGKEEVVQWSNSNASQVYDENGLFPPMMFRRRQLAGNEEDEIHK